MSGGADDPIDFKLDLSGATLDGRYLVESVLGAGGMGTVYEARDQRLSRTVVVKVPHPRFLAEEGFRERFERETRSLLQLEHPHVVKVLDVGSHRGVPYTVLQYLPGGSLDERIRAGGGRLAPAAVLTWLPSVAEALDFVHARGVVHRDVKPGNVLFDEMGHAYLADFGIAKALGVQESGLTQTGMIPGSPDYMAPESVRGADLGPAADQYSLAAMVYEALAGRLPFQGATAMDVLMQKQSANPPSLEVPGLPSKGAAVVRRALERDPTRRYPSCAAFAQALGVSASPSRRTTGMLDDAKRALRPSGALTSMATDIAPAASWGKGAWIALLGVLVLAVSVGAYLTFRGASEPKPSHPTVARADSPTPSAAPTSQPSAAPTPAPAPMPVPTPDPAPPVVPAPVGAATPTIPAMAPDPTPAPPPAMDPDPGAPISRLPPPTLILTPRAAIPITSSPTFAVTGRVSPATSKVTVGAVVATVGSDGTFTVEVPLEKEGLNLVPVKAENGDGGARRDDVKVFRDRTPPRVRVTEPTAATELSGESLRVRGRVEDATACSVEVGAVVAIVAGAEFEATVPITAAQTSVTVTAKDAAGNAAEPVVVTWKRKSKSPLDGLTPKGRNAAGFDEYALDRDPSVRFVLVPAATFFQGVVAGDGDAKEGESKARPVSIGAYLIATTEVTRAQWGRFCKATGRTVPTPPPFAGEDHPVTDVSFVDAKAYCQWAGVRLPSEAEWERAARASTVAALFAWGVENPPPPGVANLFDESRRRKLKLDAATPHFVGYDDAFPFTAPVASFQANGLGLFDMTGNVWEWCADGYEPDLTTLPATDPFTPADQRALRVLRGGAFSARPDDCRLSRRNAQPPEFRNDATGSRVARDGPR